MAEHREVRYERLYVKTPNTDNLRTTAAGRLKRMLGAGWRETERIKHADHLRVRLERSGHTPLMTRLPKPPPPPARMPRTGGPGGRPGARPGGRR